MKKAKATIFFFLISILMFTLPCNKARAETQLNISAFTKTPGAITFDQTKRSKPALVGDTVSFEFNGLLTELMYVELTLTEVVYGNDAEKVVTEANFFNASAEEGMEYCLAYFHVSIQCQDEGESFSISDNDFDVVDMNGKVYSESWSISGLEDSIKIYSGGFADFVVPIYISKGDQPLLLYDDRIWFSIDDSEGKRNRDNQERMEFAPEIPEGVFAIHDNLYVGMSIEDMKTALQNLEGIDEPEWAKTTESGIPIVLYSGMTFKEFCIDDNDKYKLLIVENPQSIVQALTIIRGQYSLLASSRMLTDYESLREKCSQYFGNPEKESEYWSDKKLEKIYSKAEGAAAGNYTIRTRWHYGGIIIELNLDKELTTLGIITDEKPRIWIGFYDASLAM